MKYFAMLGKWHVHAEGYAEELNRVPNCRVKKVWDPNTDAANDWAKRLGCTAASADDILSDPEIEGVVVCNATNEHTDLIVRACRAGKSVFTEKVLALTNEDAEKVAAAVKENHTKFAISFPHFSESGTQLALKIARDGKLGKLNYARVRKAHNGATANWLPKHFYDPNACGGGAMIDLGAHPMYLLCALLGEPKNVQSTFTYVTGKPVEDNAVSILSFDGGAIGVSETGFVSDHYPFTIEIGGTDGALLMRDGKVEYCCPETNGCWITADNLPSAVDSPLTQWAKAEKAEDISDEFGIDAALRLTRVMVEAYKNPKN